MFAMSSLSYTCAVVRNSKITIMVSSQSSYEQVWERSIQESVITKHLQKNTRSILHVIRI